MVVTEVISEWKGLTGTGRRVTAWVIGITLSLLAAVSGDLGDVTYFQAALQGLVAILAAQGLYSGIVKVAKAK